MQKSLISSFSALGLLLVLPALASDSIPAPAQSAPLLFRSGVIHPVSAAPLEGADLLVENGKITAIGRGLPVPDGTTVVELHGRHVYPGLISPNSQLGLTEHELVRATNDYGESGSFNPNVRAQVALNPDSESIPVTRANGILATLAVPHGPEGAVAGTSALVYLDGWTWEEMTIRPAVGLHVFWPAMRIETNRRIARGPEDPAKEIERRLREVKEFFAAARAYRTTQEAGKMSTTDVRFEAVIPVLKGERPVFVHAQELKQIESALSWSAAENVKIILVGAQDAWRVATRLKERGIAVICGASTDLPLRRGDAYDSAFSLPGKLFAAGVRFCIGRPGSPFEAPHERNLPYEAAMAAAHGLPKEEALKAVTLYPAQIFGVGDRLGSLEPGKEGTLIVTNGDPLEITTTVEAAYIAGRPVDLTSKHTRLRDKYLKRLGQ